MDPEAKKIKITCAVVEEEGKIKEDELRDAEKHGVQLRGAKQPRGTKKKPNMEWIDESTAKYYHHLLKGNTYDFVIGHSPHLANGCFNFRDICELQGNPPKIILIIHELPKNSDGDVDEDQLVDWLKKADVVFSIGQVLHAEVAPYITSMEPKDRPVHKMYIPSYPIELFNLQREIFKGNILEVTQNITMMTGEKQDLEINAPDFPLAVASTAAASEHISLTGGTRTNLVMLTGKKEDTEQWKKNYQEVLDCNEIKQKGLNFQCVAPENMEQLKAQMRKSNLFLFPSKFNSLIFGTEALAAIAAGVPILVSRHAGVATLLGKMAEDEPVVDETDAEPKEETWKERIFRKIVNPEAAQDLPTD